MQYASERFGIVATIDPDAYTAGAQTSDVIDMLKWHKVMFIFMSGDLGASATLDGVIKGDTTSGGSFSTTITGKAMTQFTQAGTDSDKQAIVEINGDEVLAQGFRYVRATMTIGTATSDAGMIALGECRYQPVTDHDLDSVDEVVT